MTTPDTDHAAEIRKLTDNAVSLGLYLTSDEFGEIANDGRKIKEHADALQRERDEARAVITIPIDGGELDLTVVNVQELYDRIDQLGSELAVERARVERLLRVYRSFADGDDYHDWRARDAAIGECIVHGDLTNNDAPEGT